MVVARRYWSRMCNCQKQPLTLKIWMHRWRMPQEAGRGRCCDVQEQGNTASGCHGVGVKAAAVKELASAASLPKPTMSTLAAVSL